MGYGLGSFVLPVTYVRMMIATRLRRQWLFAAALTACAAPPPSEAPPAPAPEAVVIETAPPEPKPPAAPLLADRLADHLDHHEAELVAAREREDAERHQRYERDRQRLMRDLADMDIAAVGALSARPSSSAGSTGTFGGLGHGGGGVAGIGGGALTVAGSAVPKRRITVGSPHITGPLDPNVARRVLSVQARRIANCLKSPQPTSRTIIVTFSVDPSGAVTSPVVAGPTGAEKSCAQAFLATQRFPAGATPSRVNATFTVTTSP
jgi:hypothetical protein